MPGKADTVIQWALSRIGQKPKREPHLSARFVQQAYRSVGIQIPGSTIGQITNTRHYPISRRMLAPGDIVFPDLRSTWLYVGHGQVIGVNPRGMVQQKTLVRFWKAARLTTPGGGIGLGMARPGLASPEPRSTPR